MNRKFLVFAAVLMLVACSAVRPASGDVFAAENRSEALYGQGVHAFFGNEYQEAIDLLSEVEKLKSEDPRPYFFLGLAYGRLGDDDKAIVYLKKAARLEWDGRSTRDFNVSETLRRIQGYERLTVEEFRKNARTEWQNEAKRKKDIKYGEDKEKDLKIVAKMAQPSVVKVSFGASSVNPFGVAAETVEPVALPKTDTAKKEPIKKPEAKKAVNDDPFAAPKEDKEKKAEAMDDEDDPFAAPEDGKDKKAEAMEEDEDDPFADSSDKEKEPEPKKADTDEDDEDDPFK